MCSDGTASPTRARGVTTDVSWQREQVTLTAPSAGGCSATL
jgi:hypothetical protein